MPYPRAQHTSKVHKEVYTVFAFLCLLVWTHLTIHINIMTFRNWNLALLLKCTTGSATNTSWSWRTNFLAEAAMFYDNLFDFFDSIPTVTFIAWFTPIYFSLHYFAYRLFLLHPRFQGVSLDKQTFILINFMESLLLALMRYIHYFLFLYINCCCSALLGWMQFTEGISVYWTRWSTPRTPRSWSTWPPCT